MSIQEVSTRSSNVADVSVMRVGFYRFDCKYSPAKAVNEQNSEQKNESNRNTTIQCICQGTFVNTYILYFGFDSTFLYIICLFCFLHYYSLSRHGGRHGMVRLGMVVSTSLTLRSLITREQCSKEQHYCPDRPP